jgi:hypothetical protein
MKNQSTSSNKKWYTETIWIIILVVLFFPVGLFLMWKYSQWNKAVKWIVTVTIAIFVLTSFASSNSTTSIKNESAPAASSQTAQTPTPKPVKQLDLKVINLIVKRINMDQCRYFFALRNNEDTAFPGGTVSLGLHKLDNVWPESGSDEWKFNKPIDPQTNGQFYTDSSLCPNTVEKDGIATYAYEVDDKNGNTVSKADNQSITTEFEDLTSE